MFWNKKDEKQTLPDLPPLQSPFSKELPQPPESQAIQQKDDEEKEDDFDDFEKHSLPSFPDSPIARGFSQAAIKDAISNESTDNQNNQQPSQPKKNFKTIEVEDSMPAEEMNVDSQNESNNEINTSDDSESSLNLGPPPKMIRSLADKAMTNKREPEIFIKIDKFNSARRALASAHEQIEHIDELLKKIRESKLREEQELASWEKELATVKSRIQNITDTIFEKI